MENLNWTATYLKRYYGYRPCFALLMLQLLSFTASPVLKGGDCRLHRRIVELVGLVKRLVFETARVAQDRLFPEVYKLVSDNRYCQRHYREIKLNY